MNALELQLLEKFVKPEGDEDFDKMPNYLADLAKRVLSTKKDLSRRAKKDLEKVVALFEKHDFWSTQPVQTVYDLVEEDDFNRPVEQRDVSEI